MLVWTAVIGLLPTPRAVSGIISLCEVTASPAKTGEIKAETRARRAHARAVAVRTA